MVTKGKSAASGRAKAKTNTEESSRSQRQPRTVVRNGRRYVEIPEEEYERLQTPEPPLPKPNASGNRPAVETMQAMLAREVLGDRRRLGLTQAELARLAGVRVETICRIETGKHTPTISTMEKIDDAFKRVNAQNKRRSRRAKA